MVHLDYRDVRPIYVQIMDGIREQISSGVLHAGDRLPSVRELAGQLAINPNTIQRAYRQLEADGWIATVPGKGCFVAEADDPLARQRERWFGAFDESAAALIALGITAEQLSRRLRDAGEKP